jgi:hypothetical protein
MKKYLEIASKKNLSFTPVSIDVTDKTESTIEKLWKGMTINLNSTEYYIRLKEIL